MNNSIAFVGLLHHTAARAVGDNPPCWWYSQRDYLQLPAHERFYGGAGRVQR